MRRLSKSKLISFRQCPRRLWLELHQPELAEQTTASQALFQTGHSVGEVARHLYDPKGKGVLVDAQAEGFDAAFARSRALLASSHPVFEAGFEADGALAFADVMLPSRKGGTRVWHMVEVKSSTSVKDYHLDDVAIQAHIARRAGVPLASIRIAHVDNQWVYPGNQQFDGLLVEKDVTDQAFDRSSEVAEWIMSAQTVAAARREPKQSTGKHCREPFECPFLSHCKAGEYQARHPIEWLPGTKSKALKIHLDESGARELSELPDELLNEIQRRVKQCTVENRAHFDQHASQQELGQHGYPAIFLDFETISFAVPRWKSTRPYQQLPFQFSAHRLSRTGRLNHSDFLDLTGKDPSSQFVDALLEACGKVGPIYVYNATFEASRIRELAERFKSKKALLRALVDRIVDLLPIARKHYYHPSQEGSWSIKAVLPAVAPELRYDQLDGVQDGGLAMQAFEEAIAPDTHPERKAEIERQLRAYCRLDTYAMVRLWGHFAGRSVPEDR